MSSSLTPSRSGTPRSVTAVRSRERLLSELRVRGARGGVIAQHRAMKTIDLTPARLLTLVILPLALAALVVLALPRIADAWAWVLDAMRGPLGLPGGVARRTIAIGSFALADVPFLTTTASAPARVHWGIVGLLSALALLVSLLLPSRFLPLAYYLRFAVLVQASAFVVFALGGEAFPYLLPQYLLGFTEAGTAMLVLVPLVLGLTFFPFDIALWRKVGLTVLVFGHLVVLLPLQILLHAYLIHHLSLLVMPSMLFLFGVMIEVFAFVALYGWGMSWRERPS
jgi:hypothetical protein